MKKLLAILAVALTTSAFADKIIIETRDAEGAMTTGPHVSGKLGPSQYQNKLTYAKDIDTNWQVDYSIIATQDKATGLTQGGRIEAGAMYRNKLGDFPVYIRGGYGQKTTTKSDFPYYSIEPGVLIPMGSFTGRIGYRFRDAVDPSKAHADETRTWRYGLGYNFDKNHSVWLRYDIMRGDVAQNVKFVSYEYKW